jgi:hypothetical protein
MRFSPLLAVVLGTCAPNPATADTSLADYATLEWLTDAHPTVVIATVAREQAPGAKMGITRLKKVERVIKGEVNETVPVIGNLSEVVTASGENRVLLFLYPRDETPTLRVRYVVYLNAHTQPKDKSRAFYLYSIMPELDRRAFPDNRCVALDKTGRALTDPDAVVKLVEARARQYPKRAAGDGFLHLYLNLDIEVSSDIIMSALVPRDPEFEQSFLKLLKSERGWVRAEAATILRYYKSPEVIAALKKCLTDDFVGDLPTDWSDPPRRRPDYTVRKAAYESLLEMGVKVPRPELQAPEWLPIAPPPHLLEKPQR